MDSTAPDYYEHPVFHSSRLMLETPAIRRVHEDVTRLIWTGATGALLIGQARQGKSTAVRSLIGRLQTRDRHEVPVYYVSMPRRDQSNITTVLREMSWSVNLNLGKTVPADLMADQFVHYLADQASALNCPKALLVVDETQRLAAGQLDAFAEVHDKLLLMDVELTTLFVANDPECWPLIEKIQGKNYRHIHGRFFTQAIRFQGLSSAKEVIACLKQYDRLQHPEYGPTYTSYFLPKSVSQGWQFSSLGRDLWRIFNEYQRDYKIPSWGMKYFTVTANTLLCDLLPQFGTDAIEDDLLHESIRVSGLIPSLVRPSS